MQLGKYTVLSLKDPPVKAIIGHPLYFRSTQEQRTLRPVSW